VEIQLEEVASVDTASDVVGDDDGEEEEEEEEEEEGFEEEEEEEGWEDDPYEGSEGYEGYAGTYVLSVDSENEGLEASVAEQEGEDDEGEAEVGDGDGEKEDEGEEERVTLRIPPIGGERGKTRKRSLDEIQDREERSARCGSPSKRQKKSVSILQTSSTTTAGAAVVPGHHGIDIERVHRKRSSEELDDDSDSDSYSSDEGQGAEDEQQGSGEDDCDSSSHHHHQHRHGRRMKKKKRQRVGDVDGFSTTITTVGSLSPAVWTTAAVAAVEVSSEPVEDGEGRNRSVTVTEVGGGG
jgi:hypothetical protein